MAYYEDHLSYKNTENGIMGSDLGLVTFRNITVVSNRQHGFSFEAVISVQETLKNRVDGAIVVGSSNLIGG